MKSVHAYLFRSFILIIFAILGVVGLGLWLSVNVYLSKYIRHLRQLTRHHRYPGLIGQSHMGLNTLYHFLHAMAFGMALTTLIALASGWFVASLISRSFTRSVDAITSGAYAMARGATNVEVVPTQVAEFAQLATALNSIAKTFKAAETERRERLEDLAHEIRTPLTALIGYSRSLSGTIPDSALSPLVTEIARITRLAERLPDAAPLASYFYQRVPVSAHELLSPVWELYQPLLSGRHILSETDWNPDIVFDVDPPAIREAIHNLLSNALKFTPEHGIVRLTAEPSALDGYGVIVVEDSGPGIPDSEREHITKRTIRLDPKASGHGIGLAMVQSIAEAHGGQIAIQSSPLGGTALVLTLPLYDDVAGPLS